MSKTCGDDEILIRKATKEDMVEVSAMIQQYNLCQCFQGLADSQGMPTGPKLSAKDLQRDGFETQWPTFQCKIAEFYKSGAVAGFTIFFPTYSTWEGRAMMLQNLYVKEEFRRLGLGRMLFHDVASEAVASGCKRVDFHVLTWNRARAFYESEGAQNLTELEGAQYYRLSGAALAAAGQELQHT